MEVLANAAAMKDATSAFLNKQTVHNGIIPNTDTEALDKVLLMYRELRGNDRIVTLNMIVAEVRRMDSGSKDLSLSAIQHQICWHLCKYNAVRHRATHMSQHMRYDEGFKAGYVAFVMPDLNRANTRPVAL
jgi:hypothetical protein